MFFHERPGNQPNIKGVTFYLKKFWYTDGLRRLIHQDRNVIFFFIRCYSANGMESFANKFLCRGAYTCMSLMRAGEHITPVVEMTRNAEVKRGAAEQQMVTYQEGNRTQRDTECQKCN